MKEHLIVHPKSLKLGERMVQGMGTRKTKEYVETIFKSAIHDDCLVCAHRMTERDHSAHEFDLIFRQRCGARKCEKAKYTKDGPMPEYLEHKKKLEEEERKRDHEEKLKFLLAAMEAEKTVSITDAMNVVSGVAKSRGKKVKTPSKNIPDHPDAGSW